MTHPHRGRDAKALGLVRRMRIEVGGVVEPGQPPPHPGESPFGYRRVVGMKARQAAVLREPEEADQRGPDDPSVAGHHDQLSRMGFGDLVERILRPVQEVQPALASRRQRSLGFVARQQPAVALFALGPGEPVRLARVPLAEHARGLVGDVPERRAQDGRRLDCSREDARIQSRRLFELASTADSVRQGEDLAAPQLCEAAASGVAADEVLGIAHRLTVTDQHEPRPGRDASPGRDLHPGKANGRPAGGTAGGTLPPQVKCSTNASSWRRFRHS